MLEEAVRDTGKAPDARGWLERGRLLAEKGDFAAALRAFDAASLPDPALEGLDRARARVCLAAGLHARGLEAIDRHLRASPDDPLGLVVRARLLAAAGLHPDAVLTWDHLLRGRTPTEPDHVIERARESVAAGDSAGALRGLDEARERLGPVPAIDHLAVDLEVDRGNFDGALSRIERAKAGRAPRGAWELRRAEVLEAAGRKDAANAAYAAARAELLGRTARGRVAPVDLARRAWEGLARTGSRGAPTPRTQPEQAPTGP